MGVEYLKNLSLLNFKKIDIIDMDTVSLTNLNRQFMFNTKDIGRFKAEVVKEQLLNKMKSL